jgi:hypothetical protein
VLLAVLAAPAAAQMNHSDMQAAMQAAQAAANRPGDEKLTCEQLQAELNASANNPALQSSVASAGAAAQERAAPPSGGAQTATTVLGSVVPGADMAGLAAAAAQGQAQGAQASANVQQRMAQSQSRMGNLPQMMRGQRVLDLAQARNCAWARGAAPR